MIGGRSGVVLLDKPADMTSFQALRGVKDALGIRRVGHAGTLDRFATGLLVVVTGAYTRLVELFSGLDKTYRALMILGAETDTLDPEGAVVGTGPIPALGAIERAAGAFRGGVLQVPPAYSALHVEGRRAHELSRAGTPPRMAARPVTIHSLELRGYEPPELEFEVRCSKGTYVRSLARDLAVAAGSRGHLKALRRLAVGPYGVEEAVSPQEFAPSRDLLPVRELLERLAGVSCRSVGPDSARAILNGKPLEQCLSWEMEGASGEGDLARSADTIAVFDPQQQLLAVADRQGQGYRYRAVFREQEA